MTESAARAASSGRKLSPRGQAPVPPAIEISVSTACGPASDRATGCCPANATSASQLSGGCATRSGRRAITCVATSSGSAQVRPPQR